ncbi:sensor histidine kinase [Thiohalomonas denitrificans]|uniref:histidine kinase n=1 Tax=Thiohalomonas denitrificans TaxID=415747 RepID=A0A1G5Q209_9GAMM|nr:ATP-binding protein [Thiohalomonas denitrificans]SCZ55692.1 GAF domain-containing protein [Thiohalomonas denitrificans]
MASRADTLRYRHTLLTFVGVLLAFSLVGDALLVAQQRKEFLNSARVYAVHELKLLGTWTATASDISTMGSALRNWAQQNPAIVSIHIRDGETELLEYSRDRPARYTFEVEHTMTAFPDRELHLTMNRDFTRIEEVVEKVRLQLIAGSTIFIAVLGSFLWITVRRMALLPMRRYEDELHMHRYRLERLVQERTAELTATNRNLQNEVEEKRQAEHRLRRSTERLKVLREVDQAILAARSLPEIAEGALSHISDLLPCKRIVITLFDLQKAEAEVLALRTDQLTRLRIADRLPIDVKGIPDSVRNGEPFIVRELNALEQLSVMEQIFADEGARAYAIVPITYRDELLGALHLAAPHAGVCSGESLDVAVEVANVLALAIKQVRLNEEVQRHAAEMESRVQERTGELRDAQNEIEAFTYSVSHDLRGHLWTVQGFAELLREKYGDRLDEEGTDYVHSIGDAAQSMTVLIQDLLTYSHINRTETRSLPVSLDRAVTDALSALQKPLREKEAQVTVDTPLGEARGHHPTLVQVLSNLLDNAITYVAKGVTPRVRIYSESSADRIRLWVEDNGVGIPAEQRERIFGVFKRLHPEEAYPGTGLGLAIVQRGVSRMGGTVGVEEREGGSSRFWIELPA